MIYVCEYEYNDWHFCWLKFLKRNVVAMQSGQQGVCSVAKCVGYDQFCNNLKRSAVEKDTILSFFVCPLIIILTDSFNSMKKFVEINDFLNF